MSTLIITAAECEALLGPRAVIEVLEQAHRELATGGATQPLPVPMRAAGDGGTDAPAWVPMAAHASYLGLAAVKLLADAPANRTLGLPAQRSTVALYSAASAECLALVDGRVLTRVRTAAATALATRTLARGGSRVLGLVGAGALAAEHIRAHAAVLDLAAVVVWSRSAASRESLRESVSVADVRPVADVREVFDAADVVCTLTPSRQPLVAAKYLRAGTHLAAVGSPPRPGYRELEPDVLVEADRVVVDDVPVALHESDNVRCAVGTGRLDPAVLADLGSVLAGLVPGRRHDDEVTVFNSVGIGLQDLAALELLHRLARAAGVGREVDLR